MYISSCFRPACSDLESVLCSVQGIQSVSGASVEEGDNKLSSAAIDLARSSLVQHDFISMSNV